jgi:hypothetical protein
MKQPNSLVYVSYHPLVQELLDSYGFNCLTKLEADISLHGGLEELNGLITSLGMVSLPILQQLGTILPTHWYLRMLCYD